jgi:hypothetical protein
MNGRPVVLTSKRKRKYPLGGSDNAVAGSQDKRMETSSHSRIVLTIQLEESWKLDRNFKAVNDHMLYA